MVDVPMAVAAVTRGFGHCSHLVPRLRLGTHCLPGSAWSTSSTSAATARQSLACISFPGGAWERDDSLPRRLIRLLQFFVAVHQLHAARPYDVPTVLVLVRLQTDDHARRLGDELVAFLRQLMVEAVFVVAIDEMV